MPAAAVIPAPIVYIKVAAVKKLVVGFRSCRSVVSLGVAVGRLLSSSKSIILFIGAYWMLTSYFLVTFFFPSGREIAVPDSLL